MQKKRTKGVRDFSRFLRKNLSLHIKHSQSHFHRISYPEKEHSISREDVARMLQDELQEEAEGKASLWGLYFVDQDSITSQCKDKITF